MDGCYISGHSGIDNLVDKSLISVSRNWITMHDLMQQMGRDMVYNESPSEPERRSRLWNPDDICNVLRENTGTRTLKGMLLDISRISELELKPDAFVKMPNLKFLKFYDSNTYKFLGMKPKIFLPGGLPSLPDELRYLYWMGYPLKTLPTRFDPRNLVELDMRDSHVEQLWEGKQDLVNLKKINLKSSENLVGIPDLSSATNLEELVLSNCTNLLELPSLYKSTSLTSLDLRGCSKIFRFPEVSSNVGRLLLDGTAIEQVPSSVEFLTQLVTLSMENCARLNNFPSAICNIRSLHFLSLKDCPKITTFPEISANIKNLQLGGTAIEEVPSWIECLSNLCQLDLKHCRRLKSVSVSIHKLKSLHSFFLQGCSRLENFPKILETMETLNYLDLSGTALKKLPSSMENLIGLQHLGLQNCKNLVCLPDNLYKLKSLRALYLGGCSRLEKFPEILETMETLNYLDLSGTALKELPSSMVNIIGLIQLRLNNCENLGLLPDNLFPAIGGASLTGGSEIQKRRNGLSSLEILGLRKCKRLRSLPELPPNLLRLETAYSSSLKDVSSIKRLFEKVRGIAYQKAFRRGDYVKACIPGSEIPEWFDFKSLGSSINIQLPWEWYNNNSKNFQGFVLSAVISSQLYSDDMDFDIRCECHLKSCNGDVLDLSLSPVHICGLGARDIDAHGLFGWDQLVLFFHGYKNWQFVETQASNEYMYMYNQASFKFYAEYKRRPRLLFEEDGAEVRSCSWKVKQCGAHPLFSNDGAEIQTPKRVKYGS